MTPTSALLAASGLSHREAAAFFGVSKDTIRSWSCGRLKTPQTATEALIKIVQDNLAAAHQIAAGGPSEGHSELVVGLSFGVVTPKTVSETK